MAVKKIADRRFKRVKKPRIKRTEEYLINSRYIGEEPVHDGHILTDNELGRIYSWYSYMCKASDARDYIVEYLLKIGKKPIAERCKNISDGRVPTTAGWICRILTRGGNVPQRTKDFLIDRINKALIDKGDNEFKPTQKEERPVKSKASIQESIRDRARDIIGDIEQMIDSGKSFSVYEYIQKNSIPSVYMTYIINYYQKMVNELIEVSNGKDSQLNEAYSRWTKKQIQSQLDMYISIIEDAVKFTDNAKKIKKANRKPRVVSVEKILKKFKYKKNDQEYKLVSVEPQTILAAQELWIFNTKYRILQVFKAQDESGLGVRGTKIIGYNPSTSSAKRLRKPNEIIPNVMSGGKVTLRTLMDEIKTKPASFRDRISEDCILLRTVK